MRWLLLATLRRGVLTPPEVLDDEHARLAEMAERMEFMAEMEHRTRLSNQRETMRYQRARAARNERRMGRW